MSKILSNNPDRVLSKFITIDLKNLRQKNLQKNCPPCGHPISITMGMIRYENISLKKIKYF